MKHKLTFSLSILLSTFFILPVMASNQLGARVTVLRTWQSAPGTSTDSGTYFLLENNGTRGTLPSCATDNYWMIKNTDVQAANKQMSVISMAYTQGLPVYIYGTGQCLYGHEIVSDMGLGG
jgi:hypothetical protein